MGFSTLPFPSLALYGLAGLGAAAMSMELRMLRSRKRKLRPVHDHANRPGVSILKPLCGLDDGLEENLRSHVAIDYGGEVEILLGVAAMTDPAYLIARRFEAAHPSRVRVLLTGHVRTANPKVAQLIALTQAARFDLLVVTDSNVRVDSDFLDEHVSALRNGKTGLSSNLFFGVEERTVGAALDNMTLATFCAPNIAGAAAIGQDQLVGKAFALRRETLEAFGGWSAVGDVLAEDQRLGECVRELELSAHLCTKPVWNVQRATTVRAFWGRHTRWAMIRFRLPMWATLFEPLLAPFVLALAALAFAPAKIEAWCLTIAFAVRSMLFAERAARIGRGRGFRARHLLLAPLREVLQILTWARGATLRSVSWRGNGFHVLRGTRLLPIAVKRNDMPSKSERDVGRVLIAARGQHGGSR